MAGCRVATQQILAASKGALSRGQMWGTDLRPSVQLCLCESGQRLTRRHHLSTFVKGQSAESGTVGFPQQLSPRRFVGVEHVKRPEGSGRRLRLSAATQAGGQTNRANLRTCKQCKQQYDPETNHPRACKYHTAHYGGETRRKFESVYEGGTLTTADGGKITAYWHCCGNQDPTDPGCEAAPHRSYDE